MKLLKPPRNRIPGMNWSMKMNPITGRIRASFALVPDMPTMTAVSAMEVRKMSERKTNSPSRIMPPKK